MKAIDLLVEEHRNIKRVLQVTRKLAIKVMNSGEVDYEGFYDAIDFIKNYADKHHHNKEEEILFKEMSDELGEPLASGPITAMFSEHDLGRMFIHNLSQALAEVKAGNQEAKVDIIANAVAYTDLLHRHIEKEDKTIYVYGQNNLAEETLARVESEVENVEIKAKEAGIQDKYIKLIDKLEKRIAE